MTQTKRINQRTYHEKSRLILPATLLALAGWALYLSNAGAVLLLPAFLAYLTQFQIKPEERALLAKFGPEFAQYMARVRRWVQVQFDNG